jgi:hypothetical protein
LSFRLSFGLFLTNSLTIFVSRRYMDLSRSLPECWKVGIMENWVPELITHCSSIPIFHNSKYATGI